MPAAEKRDPSQVMAFAKEKDLAGVAIAPFQEREYFAAAQKAGIPLLCYVAVSYTHLDVYKRQS